MNTTTQSKKSGISLVIGTGAVIFIILWFAARHKEMKS